MIPLSLSLSKKVLGPLLILAVIIVALNRSGFGTSRGVQHNLDTATIILGSMREQDDLHMAREVVSDFHEYHLDSKGEVVARDKGNEALAHIAGPPSPQVAQGEGDETVQYVSVLMIDASLPVSEIRTDKEGDRLIVCLPPIALETEIQEKQSFIWKVSDDFPNMDIEQKVADAARKRAEVKLMDGGIKQRSEENAITFFSQLFEMLGDTSVDVKFCEKSPSP